MTSIRIKPVEVSRLGQEVKLATQLIVTGINVRLVDDGVSGTFHLLSETGECVYNMGDFKLTNEEVSTWTNTDEQLLSALLLKLNLEKEVEEIIIPEEDVVLDITEPTDEQL